jgi:SET family sugar efflux transporter-like MFS transporter
VTPSLSLTSVPVATTSETRASLTRRLLPLGLMFLSVGLSTAMATPFLALFLNTALHASSAQVTVFLVVTPLSGVVA